MLKITLSFLTCACLMPRSLLASLSPAELGLYEETAPDALDDFTSLKQLADYIAAQSRKRNHQPYQFPFFVPHVHKKHHIDIINQRKHEILQLLKEKLHAGNLPKRHQITDWNYPHQNHHTDPGKEVVPKIVDHYLHHNLDSMLEGLDGFSGSKLLYQDDKLTKESQNYEGTNDGYSIQPKISPKQRLYNDQTQKENIDKQLLSDFFQSDVMSNNRQMPKENKHFGQLFPSTPEFTYYFDDSNSKEDFQFAVKPNDPRYYDDTVPPIDIGDNTKHQQLKISTNINRKDISMEDQSTRKYLISSKFPKNNEIENFTAYTSAEMDKSEGKHPLIVPIEYDLNNDIYFIAVIAGCSAAAMFALVLISLTWCRLQRGVKAAADIEYPAYGVTGPNKDVSPSEDQRLAQSAQMYHFQHQKQQIIAMENRASATRDPGSLSEAESEEENEEGDYTVYECPGLASTGEMEVKNPLFHDDPTPMTPAQTNKEEDHM